MILPPKRPTETRRYVIDRTEQLAGDPIATFAFSVTAGAVTITSSQQESDFSVSALIAGGTNGATSTLSLQLNTEGGQVLFVDLSLTTSVTALSPWPSTTTKGQIEDMAFEELGLAGYEFDATTDEQASGLRRLDSLMAMWAGPGMNLDLGYNFPAAVGGSARADASGIPDLALDAVFISLAMSMSPGYGKSMSTETKIRLAESMRAIRAMMAQIPTVTLPGKTPRGAGVKPWSTWMPFMNTGV